MITTGVMVSPFLQSMFIKYERISKDVLRTIFLRNDIYSNKTKKSAFPCTHELSNCNCLNVVIVDGNWS